MKKTILEIYALAVCFFTIACFVITLGLLIWNFVEVATPEFTISSRDYECHQTDGAYKDCFSGQYQYTKSENPEIFPSGEELTKSRKSAYAQVIKSEQRNATQGIVQKLIIIIIDLLVFFAHWVLARKARETNS